MSALETVGETLRWGLIALACPFALYLLMLLMGALLVRRGRVYEKNSPFYRFLLDSATALSVRLLRIRIHAEGVEKLPSGGRFLLVGNHRSNFDPILTWYVMKKQKLAFVSKPENFRIPIFGRIIQKCCFLPIDRENPRSAIKTIAAAVELLKRDEVSVAVYPEGTRSKDGTLLPFHNGVFKIAQRAQVPVVTVAVQGTEQIHRNYLRRRSDVRLRVVDVIPARFVRENSTVAIGKRVKDALEGAQKTTEGAEYAAIHNSL